MESRMHDLLDRGSSEGSYIEFKATLPKDARKAARQIAALANSARGEEALWLLGLDNEGQVIGCSALELSSWWSSVRSHFDGTWPEMSSIDVSRPEGIVVGLFFRTDRAPFVVKTGISSPEREVPWREGTATRSAYRHELFAALAPATLAPEIEILSAEVLLAQPEDVPDHNSGDYSENHFPWCLIVVIGLFVDALERVSFPYHRGRITIDVEYAGGSHIFLPLSPPTYQSVPAQATMTLDAPDKIDIRGRANLWLTQDEVEELQGSRMGCGIELRASGSNRWSSSEISFPSSSRPLEEDHPTHWKWRYAKPWRTNFS